jgi:dipeptidyl-peptidase-4
MGKFNRVLFALLFVIFTAEAQEMTFFDIFNPQLRDKRVQGLSWMQDSRYYSELTEKGIVQNETQSGKQVAVIFDAAVRNLDIEDYAFSKDEQKILFQTERKAIYRRSFTAKYFVYDRKTDKITPLAGGESVGYATLSPNGNAVAYTRNNNLFFANLADLKEKQITDDGKFNHIINGSCDWVYEEEFGFAQAFFWSSDSKKIAFYRFDESQVKEFNMQYWQQNELYPNDYKFKYPKAGEANSVVEIKVFDTETGALKSVDLGSEKDIYVPRVNWTDEGNLLYVRKMNRWQNELEWLAFNFADGSTKLLFKEAEPNNFVDIEYTDDLIFLKDGKHFLCTSERDGFKHVYMYEKSGKLVRQITNGNWEVIKLHGVDESGKMPKLYYTSTEVSHLERHFYVIDLDGKNKKKLSLEKGWNDVDLSPDAQRYALSHASATSPTKFMVCQTKDGKILQKQELNAGLNEVLASKGISPREFLSIKTTDGTEISGYMIKPKNFSPEKKYPVLMHVYGGPSSQQVQDNRDNTMNYFWHQYLAQKGYIIVCFDNRGTNARGAAFKKSTYLQLGKYETQDQTDAAKYLGNLPYVDKTRIGIWGWSYGGYMTALCMTVGADYFKTGISVAPVTTWRLYDTIYTERFLRRPQDNASGYDDNSPITHADKLRGNFLMIHGTGDDNVHFQNAILLQDALIAAGKQFSSFFYPNRNHGIYGGNTRLHLYQMMTDYILKNL